MFKLNKKIKYALIALKHMSQKNAEQRTTAKEVCDAYDLPFDPTARAMQLMAQHGILQASQGSHGGYQIAKDLDQVTLHDLNDLIIGPVKIADCLDDHVKKCDCIKSCIVISPLLRLNEQIHDFMNEIAIGTLINNQTHPSEARIRKKAAA